jgi:hypothetical protein
VILDLLHGRFGRERKLHNRVPSAKVSRAIQTILTRDIKNK